jgi:hypothetical protein
MKARRQFHNDNPTAREIGRIEMPRSLGVKVHVASNDVDEVRFFFFPDHLSFPTDILGFVQQSEDANISEEASDESCLSPNEMANEKTKASDYVVRFLLAFAPLSAVLTGVIIDRPLSRRLSVLWTPYHPRMRTRRGKNRKRKTTIQRWRYVLESSFSLSSI